MSNKPYLIALSHIPNLGPVKVAKLLQLWPNLKDLFALSLHDLENAGVPAVLANHIVHFNFGLVDQDLKWEASQSNHHIITLDCPNYPTLLKEIHDPPVIIYAKGLLEAFQKPTLAIVGTRKPSPTGAENAKYFAKALTHHSVTIVSGLALGIDAQAHQGCLENQGSTIAVMGTGIECIYPYRHRELAAKIIEKGIVLSEFSLKSPPIAGHFPRRNRIISGLSLATLIIEAAIKSGSLITARFALEQNRDVLAIPGSIHNPQSRGCNLLLQQGAKLVSCVDDILETLQIEYNTSSTIEDNKKQSISGFGQYIGFETTTVDQILVRSQKNIEEVTSALANLEILGLIKTVPGGYIRC